MTTFRGEMHRTFVGSLLSSRLVIATATLLAIAIALLSLHVGAGLVPSTQSALLTAAVHQQTVHHIGLPLHALGIVTPS